MYFNPPSSSNMAVVHIGHSIYNYILLAGQDWAIRELKSPEEFQRHYLTLMGHATEDIEWYCGNLTQPIPVNRLLSYTKQSVISVNVNEMMKQNFGMLANFIRKIRI